jgi:prevent-host-death family protein
MKRMPAGAFKAQCLAVMDQVLESGEAVLVTKHGRPVVKIIPAEKQADDLFGYMAGKVKIVGDIVGPDSTLPNTRMRPFCASQASSHSVIVAIATPLCKRA